MRLGLVCMMNGKSMRKGITGIKAMQNMDDVEFVRRMRTATEFNIQYTKNCIQWCIDNKVGMYRVSSNIVPYYEFWDWVNFSNITNGLTELYDLAKNNNIRLTVHPDQFTVINSEKQSVIDNSVKILEHHFVLSCYLGINEIIIHTGSSSNDYKERFINNCLKLDKRIINKVVLENCHKVGIDEVIEICRATGLKPCLDLHHDRIKPSVMDVSHYVSDIKSLWDRKPIGHISSGRTSDTDISHNDFIIESDVEKFRKFFDLFDLEIEAKKKDVAILELKSILKKIDRQ